jgi:hypothetical protein
MTLFVLRWRGRGQGKVSGERGLKNLNRTLKSLSYLEAEEKEVSRTVAGTISSLGMYC